MGGPSLIEQPAFKAVKDARAKNDGAS